MGGGSSKGTMVNKPIGQTGLKAPKSLAVIATSNTRDWNEEFQRALDLLDAEDYVMGYSNMASVCSDFHAKAQATNDIIISELSIIDNEKTYLPSTKYSAGEGFTMYEAHNIMFKVGHSGQGSSHWIELGNEFRSTTQLMRCRLHAHDKHASNIATPLMCLIDYKGVRTLCWAQLPRREKLVLGWDPVLKGFILDSPELMPATVRAGKMLGLALHSLGTGSLAVRTTLHADVNAWCEELPGNARRRKRVYITNLKNLYPTDLSMGGTLSLADDEPLPPDVHVETPEKVRPEFVPDTAAYRDI